jgi:hypothetical protein
MLRQLDRTFTRKLDPVRVHPRAEGERTPTPNHFASNLAKQTVLERPDRRTSGMVRVRGIAPMRKNLISIGLLSCLLWSCTSSTSAPDDEAATGATTTTSSTASTAQTSGTSASTGSGAGGSNA